MLIFNYRNNIYIIKIIYESWCTMKKAIIVLSILCGCLIIQQPLQKVVFAQPAITISNNQHELTKEDAKNLLIKYNDKVDYIYQGNASKFEYLKSKNLEGYVFLPDVETDIGYFVDKNTGDIYYFHPSGYLELVNDIKK